MQPPASKNNATLTCQHPCFLPVYKGEPDEFLFSSQGDVVLPNGMHSSRKEFVPRGADLFLEGRQKKKRKKKKKELVELLEV